MKTLKGISSHNEYNNKITKHTYCRFKTYLQLRILSVLIQIYSRMDTLITFSREAYFDKDGWMDTLNTFSCEAYFDKDD